LKNNKVGVLKSEDMLEAKGGMAFNVTFGASGKSKLPPTRMGNSQKEGDFEN
jgi:hypothetical protein